MEELSRDHHFISLILCRPVLKPSSKRQWTSLKQPRLSVKNTQNQIVIPKVYFKSLPLKL